VSEHGKRSRGNERRSEFMFKKFFDPSKRNDHDPLMHEAEQFWNRLADFTVPADQAPRETRRPWRAYGAIAAAVCTMLVGVTVWQNWSARSQPWRAFAAPHGRQTLVMLEDGSSITLSPESRVAVRLSDDRRALRLITGQAFFKVAHDRRRPFVVQAGKGSVTAVGTAFNIRLDDARTEVTVAAGIVDVGVSSPGLLNGAQTVARARQAEQVSFSLGSRDGSPVVYVSRRANVDVGRITAWTRGKLFFDGEPLSSAIRAVNAYATKKLVLRNAALASMPVYGVVNQGDVQGLLVLVNDRNAITIEN
jgi:transmembrane sensor